MKECLPTQVRNPKTGRCVKRDGKIGQSLLSNMKIDELYTNTALETIQQYTHDTKKTRHFHKGIEFHDFEEEGQFTDAEIAQLQEHLEIAAPKASFKLDYDPIELFHEYERKDPQYKTKLIKACEKVVARLKKTDQLLYNFLKAFCVGLGKTLGVVFDSAPTIVFSLMGLHLYLHHYLSDETARSIAYLLSPMVGYFDFNKYFLLIAISLTNTYVSAFVAKLVSSAILLDWFFVFVGRALIMSLLAYIQFQTRV